MIKRFGGSQVNVKKIYMFLVGKHRVASLAC